MKHYKRTKRTKANKVTAYTSPSGQPQNVVIEDEKYATVPSHATTDLLSQSEHWTLVEDREQKSEPDQTVEARESNAEPEKSIDEYSYRELQELAKEHGVDARQSTEDLTKELQDVMTE